MPVRRLRPKAVLVDFWCVHLEGPTTRPPPLLNDLFRTAFYRPSTVKFQTPNGQSRLRGESRGFLLLGAFQEALLAADSIDFTLNCELVDASERQTNKQADAAVQHEEGIVKRSLYLFFSPLRRGRVRNAPMCRQWLTWPDRANLSSSVVTHREDEIKLGGARSGELIPVLAPVALS